MTKKTKKWAALTATVLLGLGSMTSVQAAVSSVTGDGMTILATPDTTGEQVAISAITVKSDDTLKDNAALVTGAYLYNVLSNNLGWEDGKIFLGKDNSSAGYGMIIGNSNSFGYEDYIPVVIGMGNGRDMTFSHDIGKGTSYIFGQGNRVTGDFYAEDEFFMLVGTGNKSIGGLDGIGLGRKKNMFAFGADNTVAVSEALAFGTNNSVYGLNSAAFGRNNDIGGDDPTGDNYKDNYVYGANNIVKAANTVILGTGNQLSSFVQDSLILGVDNNIQDPGENALVLGMNITSVASNSVVIGDGSTSEAADTVSIGSATKQRKIVHVATGTDDTDAVNYAQLKSYVAEHGGSGESGTSYTGSDTITIGTDNKISVTNMAMSTTGANLGATAGGEYSFAIGGSAVASGNQSVALGYKAVAGSTDSEETLEGATVAIGATANATGNGSVALGYGAATTGNDAVAFGSFAQADAKDSAAIGSNAHAYNTGTMAFGAESKAYGEGSATFGYNTFAGGVRSIAFGNEAKTGLYVEGAYYGGGDSAVAIGDNSWAIGNYNVAIGYGAAAGISADYQTMVVGGTAIGLGAGAFGEGATAIGDGSRVNNQGATAIGLDTYSNADFSTSVGFTAQAFGESGTAIGYQAVVGSDKGITTEYGNKVSTVSFGHQKDDTYYESNTSGGFDVKTYTDTVLARLTNVADGKGNTDAATYGQIIKAQALTTDANTGLVTKVTPYTFENGVATIYTNNGGIAFQLEMPSGTISTEDGTSKGDGYITGKEVANELALKNADGTSYTGTYAQTGKTTGQNLAALDTQVVQNTSDISTLKTQVSGFESKIDGVKLADSDLEFDFSGGKTSVTQNVNYSDGTSKAFSITISGISGGADSAVIGDTTKLSDKGLGDNVTDSILSVNDKLVKEGTYTATNGKVEVKNNAGNVAFTIDGLAVSSADVGDTSKLSAAGLGDNVTDSILSVNDKVGSLSDDINKVGAGAAALAALRPEGFDPDDKWSFAVGYGHYKNANAGALGAFFKPNADTTVSLGGTIGNGDPMMNAGVSFKIGNRGKKAGTYRNAVELVRRVDGLEATMTKEVKRNDIQDSRLNAQEKKIAELEANIAKMQQKIAALLSESGAAN